jgi:hypothetical protein
MTPTSPLESTTRDIQYPWLVMLYLAGDNNLTEDMVFALQDLQAVGSTPGTKIVAQLDPSSMGLATQRYDLSESRPTRPDGRVYLQPGIQLRKR